MMLRSPFKLMLSNNMTWAKPFSGSGLHLVYILFTSLILCEYVNGADFERFKQLYTDSKTKMWQADGEIAEVENFVYKKDVATFHFEKGKIILQQPVEDRPTLAVFVGKGWVSVRVPSYVERECLKATTGDSTVKESFDVCFIRFGDNLDLKLRSKYVFSEGRLSPNEARRVKQSQGEYFFRSTIYSKYDNYFQLVRSAFNRRDDGYFWADFNRYVFSFDPTRAEEIEILYDLQPTSIVASRAAQFQRKERLGNDDGDLSQITYPITCVSQHTEMVLGGADGYFIESANSSLKLLVQRDSVQFLSVFLDRNLNIDSVYCNGVLVHWHRRRSFEHLGIILNGWIQHKDTVSVKIWYRGKNYRFPYPLVESPVLPPHSVNIDAPWPYNYALSGGKVVNVINADPQRISSRKGPSKYVPHFVAMVTGYDTTTVITSWGLPVHFVKPSVAYDGFLKSGDHRNTMIQALEFMFRMLGPPAGFDELTVLPRATLFSEVGIIGIPDDFEPREKGGFTLQAGRAAARQWFNSSTQIASYRDHWILEALPEYLGMLFVEKEVGSKFFYTNLSYHRQTLLYAMERRGDLPLACGIVGWTAKGVWVIHMLRNLINSVDSVRDQQFVSCIRNLVQSARTKPVSNDWLAQLAESYFGYELGWFFTKWVYGTDLPNYEISYSTRHGDDGYYMDMHVVIKGAGNNFFMPILIRIDNPNGPSYFEPLITSKYKDYHFGPFESEPTRLYFNKYFSVLSRDKVKSSD